MMMNQAENTQTELFPRIWPTVGWIILYFVLQIAISIAFLAGAAIMHPGLLGAVKAGSSTAMSNPIIAQGVLWGLLLSGVVTLGIMWLNLRKNDRANRIGLFGPSRLDLKQTVTLGAALVVGVFAFNYIYTTYVIPGVELQDDLKALLKALSTGPLNIGLKYLVIAGIAPALEELLFRGYLQNSLMPKMNHHAAIWLAALIFGAVHLQPLATPALTALGVAFGYLYYKTGSLKTNIALHMINNGLALAFS